MPYRPGNHFKRSRKTIQQDLFKFMKAEGRTYFLQKEKKRTACLYGLWDPLALGSSEFSADDSPMGKEGQLWSPTAGGGSVRACGEQTNRSQEHGWVCGKKGERFKVLNSRMALCLPLTKWMNTVSNALQVYAPKPTDFALSYLFQNHSITAAQITASHSEPAVENCLLRVQVRKAVAKNQNIYFHNYKQFATDFYLCSPV